jgi:hypothetical protein
MRDDEAEAMKRGRPKAETAKPVHAEPPIQTAAAPEEAPEEPETSEAQSSIDPQERSRRREEERRDAEAALTEYFAEQEAARDRMAKLRAQRLAKEAEDKGKPTKVKQKRT